MSVLGRIGEFVAQSAGNAFSAVIETVRHALEGDPATRRQVAFSVAMIALSAKMAKADGVVTPDEVDAFRDIFAIPERQVANVARLYDLAKQDVAGFDSYASQVRALFPDDPDILEDVMDGLFHIAKADGVVHEMELAFLDEVARIFGIDERSYDRIKQRHVHPEDGDPYLLLEADADWDNETLRRHYRKIVTENHPDRLIARGVPPEFVTIANDRLAAINHAWDVIRAQRGM